MIKKITIWTVFFAVIIFSIGADAALQWKVGAFIGTFAAGVTIAIGLAGAAPIVVAGALAVGAHAAVIGLYWDDVNPPQVGGAAASAGLSVVIDANTPFVTPSGWDAAPSGAKEPTPPPLEQVTTTYTMQVPVSYAGGGYAVITGSTLNDFVVDLTSKTNAVMMEAIQVTPTQISIEYYYADRPSPAVTSSGTFNAVSTCHAGYSQIAGTSDCELIDPQQVKKPSDDVCEVSVQGGQFIPSGNDPDCENTAIVGMGTSTLTAATPNKAVYLATSAAGGVTVYEKTYNNSTNTTSLSTANFNPSSDLDFIQTANSLGNNVGINPAGGAGGSGSGTGDAKDSSLNVVEGGDDPLGDGNHPTAGVAPPTQNIGTSLNPLRNWAVPTGSGVCPSGTFSAFGESFTLDAHCQIFEDNMPVIRQAFGVVFSISALFIVLGA